MAAGSSGLAGLVLTLNSEAKEVVITDGNEQAATSSVSVFLHKTKETTSFFGFQLDISATLELNPRTNWKATSSQGLTLLWDRNEKLTLEPFDFLIAADWFVFSTKTNVELIHSHSSLFLEEYHEDLVVVLRQLLKPNGMAYIFAPTRGNRLNKFLALLKHQETRPKVVVKEHLVNYDDTISKLHTQLLNEKNSDYDPDLHYPHLLKLGFE